MVNTYPCNPFPISSEQLHKGDNEELQAQINAIKDGSVIDSFGDVETALDTKADNDIIAPEFDAEAGTYEIGDMVMYEGKLYEFTSAHETAGEWDSTEVSEKTVADEIGTVKSGLINLDGLVNCRIGVFGTFKSVSSSDNIQYVKFTVPSDNYMTLNGFLFSRYGVYGVMVRTGASGTVFETTLTPIIEATGNTASISYSNNDVTIDLGQTWSTATLILVQPSTNNSPNVIKNMTVTYLSPT